jgi:UDP-3-O-[3-hydroxymyristoyl] glucosamine N-acyltransferase
MKLSLIASKLDCILEGDGDLEITGVIGLDEAEHGQLTFLSNPKYTPKLATTKASAVIVGKDFSSPVNIALLRNHNPYLTFAKAIELFYSVPKLPNEIHPSAVVSPSAKLGENIKIGANAVIGDNVELGNNTVIYPNTTIYPGAKIGTGSIIHSNCVVREFVEIGRNCILQNGVIIGADGFGYAKKDDGTWYKIVQSGIVILEDDVEIGANSTIDRATIGETRIKKGAKLDNLVMVGHASVVGENTLLCGQVGLAGSTKVGKNVTLAGQVGVAGHLTIGDNVIATAQTGIPNSVEANQVISGYPAIENRSWLKSSVIFNRLPDLQKTLKELQRRVAEIENIFKKD